MDCQKHLSDKKCQQEERGLPAVVPAKYSVQWIWVVLKLLVLKSTPAGGSVRAYLATLDLYVNVCSPPFCTHQSSGQRQPMDTNQNCRHTGPW